MCIRLYAYPLHFNRRRDEFAPHHTDSKVDGETNNNKRNEEHEEEQEQEQEQEQKQGNTVPSSGVLADQCWAGRHAIFK